MEDIIVIGGGSHAKVLISIIKRMKEYKILGYTDTIDKGELLGIQYLGKDEILFDKYQKTNLALGIGKTTSESFRMKLYSKFKERSYNFPPIISDAAIINDDVTHDQGTVVFDGVIVNPSCKLGEASIINTSASLDHDCEIGDFTNIAPGVTLSGGVKIGTNCMIGTGTSIIQDISICDDVVVGAGSVVVKNITESGVYVGNPVRKVK